MAKGQLTWDHCFMLSGEQRRKQIKSATLMDEKQHKASCLVAPPRAWCSHWCQGLEGSAGAATHSHQPLIIKHISRSSVFCSPPWIHSTNTMNKATLQQPPLAVVTWLQLKHFLQPLPLQLLFASACNDPRASSRNQMRSHFLRCFPRQEGIHTPAGCLAASRGLL